MKMGRLAQGSLRRQRRAGGFELGRVGLDGVHLCIDKAQSTARVGTRERKSAAL